MADCSSKDELLGELQECLYHVRITAYLENNKINIIFITDKLIFLDFPTIFKFCCFVIHSKLKLLTEQKWKQFGDL